MAWLGLVAAAGFDRCYLAVLARAGAWQASLGLAAACSWAGALWFLCRCSRMALRVAAWGLCSGWACRGCCYYFRSRGRLSGSLVCLFAYCLFD